MNRLGTLLLNNNRITRIAPNLGGRKFIVCVYMNKFNFAAWDYYMSNFELSSYYCVGICAEFLPKLHTLVLTNNRLTNLVEIDPLASLPKLQFLSLLDNLITKKPNYRLYVIHKLKSLRVLDFKKVKQKVSIRKFSVFKCYGMVEFF